MFPVLCGVCADVILMNCGSRAVPNHLFNRTACGVIQEGIDYDGDGPRGLLMDPSIRGSQLQDLPFFRGLSKLRTRNLLFSRIEPIHPKTCVRNFFEASGLGFCYSESSLNLRAEGLPGPVYRPVSRAAGLFHRP